MAEQPELLFFDTFSHDSSEELNLDLVQFPKPVYVSEVRIIPLGARVQGDFPGGVRLGATNPSQFQIDFFVNDLSKPGASTFETLGSLEYCQNGRIHMDCEGCADNPRQIPTDGLVLRGWYTTITLAVYGTITKSITEQVGSGPGSVAEAAPPPAPVTTPPATTNTTQPWPDLAQNPDVYPATNYPQDNYDQPGNYQPEYYNQDAPKDPRAYHHPVDGSNNIWDDKERPDIVRDRDRDIVHPRDKERNRHGSVGRDVLRLRSRSNERTRSRERNSPRYSRSRSRERDYSAIRSSTKDDNFRRENSRSPGYRDRERPLSRDKDWDRSYKREDYRRHRQPSYDRSRGGSYENKRGSPSYDKRAPSYERRPPSYENRASSFEKHLPAYEKRAPSYEKRSYDKRAPSYDRMREASYDSRSHSPTREDPRKRPRTPPIEISRRPHTPLEINNPHDRDNLSPVDSVLSEDEYDHNKRNDELYLKKPKSRKIHIKSEADLKAHPPVPKDISTYDASIVKTESQSPQNIKIGTPLDSPCPPQEDVSMDTEPFEPILSDEEICDDMEGPFADMDYDVADYCAIDDSLKCFNPFRAEWQTYAPFHKSSLYLPVDDTVHKHVMNTSLADLCSMNKHFLKLYEIVVDLKNEKYSYSNFAQLTADDKEEWVQTCEKLPSLLTNISNESDILYRIFKTVNIKDHLNDDFRSILDSLLNFCRIGLDYDLALSHIQAIFKIKHIKCGIRLIESLSANKHNEIIVMTLLDDNIDVYSKLLEIYSKNHMALSIKLLTLKSLDACLGSEATIEHFLTERFYNIFDDSSITTDHKSDLKVKPITKQLLKNGYQILIIMLSKNPLSRVKFAINALINKLNLFELLKRLHESVEQLNAKENTGQIISENEIELIINSLEEILCIYRNGSFEMSQPRRFLPVSVQFDVKRNCTNNVLIEFFNIHKLLETCLYLLTCPLTYNYPVITNPIYEVLVHLVNSHEGLMYLLENIKTTVLVFQTLIQPYNQQNDEDHLMVLQDVNNCTSLQQLGLEMAYKLQALYYIHTISDLQNGNDIDESELFDKLQGLYCLGFGNVGKLALASVLGMGDNIECLLNLYENDIHNKSTEMDDNIVAKKKSPTKNYAVDLTVCTIQFNPDVNFLKKYGRRILTVAKEFDLFEQSIASNLQEVLPYLKPLEKPKIFSNENISDIVEVIKGSIEHVTSAPGDLATSLRILKHLGISEFETKRMPLGETPKLEYTELKYKYVILQLFSLDGVSLIVNILEKICAHFEQPSLHTATFVSVHGLHLTNIILPCLELLNKMLTYVIQCRNTQYKDLTSVPIVLQTYNLMYSYPVSAVGYKMAQKACKECIEILLAHTQPIAEDPLENELIHKSLWTLLCSEVIKYILTGPYTYIPGLLVFSEILPLPLPIQTKYALTESELSKMVSNRKLWSAHLHTLSSNISEMIQSICFSVCQPVVQLLRRLCIQLTDLASNMALCITRSVLDLLISNVCNESNSLPQPMTPVGYNVARILNFLACLITHPSVKCTTLHLLRQGTSLPKSEDRYSIFIPLLCSILTTVSDNQSHVQSQECVISIISSFYDSEITLLTQFDSVPSIKMEVTDESSENTKPVMTPEIYLANAIPSKDILISLINASLEYLANENSIPSIILSVLRTFFLLTEHDYGFYYFKYCIEKNKTVMPQLFNRLVNGINKDSPECLSTFMELLRVLQSNAEDIEATEGLQFIPRTSTLSIHDIAEIIGWHKNKEHHPILTLEKFLKDINADDELLGHVRQLLSSLSSMVATSNGEVPSISHLPVLGTPEYLVTQFNGRCLWTQGDAQDERLGSTYWLGIAPLPAEDEGVEAEMVPCDLAELARTYLAAGTDLVAEAERLLHLPPAVPRPPSEPPLFRTKRLNVSRDKRPYVSPARNRGSSQLGLGVGIGIGSATSRVQVDAFRSRPPNTSRPPSLHVDDFLALETCGAQPTGPTGYNKLPVMATRGGRGLRTRGGITVTDRGRFASATPTTSSIYRRGRGAWSTASNTSNAIAETGSPPLSSHFGRSASSQHFQSPIIQYTASQYSGSVGWSGVNRGSRRGRGIRHSRASFLR